ncbi:MAG TPA: PQQ-binding-like beta-propeller repeat protein [Vicinamibacterales bacterium]|nr:PQQ-binding-like beta-propeller repeat protein [Vicinamibacterales bacterium]
MRRILVIGILLAGFCLTLIVNAQTGAKNGEWRAYGGDEASTHYSPLDQINKDTVKNLQVAWTWKFDNMGATNGEVNTTETTPLMVNGILYFTAGQKRNVVAVKAETGETLWVWHPDEGERYDRAPRKIHRGVAYWTDGKGDERILTGTPGFQLVALDAKTGQPIDKFGFKGIVDMFEALDNDLKIDPVGKIGNSSPPVVVGDTVIIGPALLVGTRVNKSNIRGDILAFDVKTGKKLWAFHTIPRKGEFGYDSWEDGSADYTGNAGMWGPFSADPQLGIAYFNIEAPTNDVYGGHRHGNNLFADSIVAVNVKTGKRVWHQQLIHHDTWDYDMPAHPILLDVTVNGRPVKAVVQWGKNGILYAFDRTNGNPLWGMEERPVPASDVPGEKMSPTQPFPIKPAPYERLGLTEDNLIDFTPALHAEALKALEGYRYGHMYEPPSVVTPTHKGTVILPGYGGGGNWQSGAADPETGFVYVPSVTAISTIGLNKNDPSKSGVDSDYTMGGPGPTLASRLPIVKPPYGRITAYNMNTGDIAWMIPNGDTPPNIKSNPALAGLTIPRTGSPSQAGLLVTKTLLIAGEGSGGQPILHAYDKATGADVWQTALPGPQTSLPMTYSINGRQFIVLGVRGTQGGGAQLVAFAIPKPAPPGGGGRGRGGAGARAGGAGNNN